MGQGIKNPRMAAGTTMRGVLVGDKHYEDINIIAWQRLKIKGGAADGSEGIAG